jgi:hypothetical protein
MHIHEYFYGNRRLYIEFSTNQDGDEFYRVLELDYDDVILYSPEIIIEEDLNEIEEDFVIEVINQYIIENDLPEQLSL